MQRLSIAAALAAALLACLFYGAGCSDRALGGDAPDGGLPIDCSQRTLAQCEDDSRCGMVRGCCGGATQCATFGTPDPVCPCIETCAQRDEASCSMGGCRADYCTECSCTPTFVGCTDPKDPPTPCPGLGCATPACNCEDLTESACIAQEMSLGCAPNYCPDCNGGQMFTGCSGPNSGAGACPADCALTMCRGQSDCHNGGPCEPPSEITTCPSNCTQEATCNSNSDCGKSQICDVDPCSCTPASKSCVPSCSFSGGCDSRLGKTCMPDGHCVPSRCNDDSDCNSPPCTGPLACFVLYCVNNQCYPSLGTCGPEPD